MANELNFPFKELTFGWSNLQSDFFDFVKYKLYVVEMLFKCLTKDYYIINEDTTNLQIQISQYVLHESLVGCWGVCESKRHTVVFVKTQRPYGKCCTLFMTL